MSPKRKKTAEPEVPVMQPTNDDSPVPVDPEVLEWEAEHIPQPEEEPLS